MKTAATIVILFGCIIALGGIMGYVKAESLVSLIVGGTSGIALIISGYMMVRQIKAGFYAALILCIGMVGFLSFRFFSTFKMMPAGILLVMSLMTLMALIICAQDRKRRR